MTTADIIGAALLRVKTQAETNRSQIIHSSEILRKDRELLLATPWLLEVIPGQWLESARETRISPSMPISCMDGKK